MFKRNLILMALTCVSLALSPGTASGRNVGEPPSVAGLDVTALVDIVADPVLQRWDQPLVWAAASALGDARAANAIPLLMELILYPLQIPACVVDGKPFPTAMQSEDGFHMDLGGARVRLRNIPMAQALIKIGDPCVPQVLAKISSTQDRMERVACLQVLLGLRQPPQVAEMLRRELALAGSAQARRSLQMAIDKLPDVDSENGDKGIGREFAAKFRVQEGSTVPPKIDAAAVKAAQTAALVRNLQRKAKTKTASGVTLVSAKDLAAALSVSVLVRPTYAGFVVMEGTRASKTLKLTVGTTEAQTTGGGTLKLSAAPVPDGKDMLVPLKDVAEYFGVKVK